MAPRLDRGATASSPSIAMRTRTSRTPKRPVRRAAVAAIAATAIVVWAVLFAPTIFGGGTSYIRVSGNSMEPTYEEHDLVVQRRQDSYAVGDVVAFRADDGVVIHRIIGGDGERGFTMQGDNNSWVDQWTPTDEDILGKTWLHVPGGGVLLDLPLEPAAAGTAAAGVVLLGGFNTNASRRRARARRRKADVLATTELDTETQMIDLTDGAPDPLASRTAPTHDRTPSAPQGPSVTPVVVCAGLAAVLLLVAVVGWTRPTTTQVTAERPVLTDTTTFDYTATMVPSTLYPDGTATAEELEAAQGGSLYTNLAQQIAVDYRHRLTGPGAVGDLSGTATTTLTVRATDGWSQTRPLGAPQSFTGTEVEGTATVDVSEVVALVSTVEAETGFTASTYTVAVTVDVDVAGLDMGPHTSSQALELTYDGTRLTGPEAREQTDTTTATTRSSRTERFGVLGLDVPVALLRGAIVPAMVLLAVGLLLAERLRRQGHAQLAILRARHGSRIVTVGSVDRPADAAVQVSSFNDLVRIVERTDGVILDLTRADDGHDFIVQDGASTYEYRVPARPSAR